MRAFKVYIITPLPWPWKNDFFFFFRETTSLICMTMVSLAKLKKWPFFENQLDDFFFEWRCTFYGSQTCAFEKSFDARWARTDSKRFLFVHLCAVFYFGFHECLIPRVTFLLRALWHDTSIRVRGHDPISFLWTRRFPSQSFRLLWIPFFLP